MYAECVTGPRAVFNRTLNKGGTFFLALSGKRGGKIQENWSTRHLRDCPAVPTTVPDWQRFNPGWGQRCFLCHQNSEKVVKSMPFCYPGALVGAPSAAPLQAAWEPRDLSFPYPVAGEADCIPCATVHPPSLPC